MSAPLEAKSASCGEAGHEVPAGILALIKRNPDRVWGYFTCVQCGSGIYLGALMRPGATFPDGIPPGLNATVRRFERDLSRAGQPS